LLRSPPAQSHFGTSQSTFVQVAEQTYRLGVLQGPRAWYCRCRACCC